MPAQFTSTLIDQVIKGRCADFADLMGLHKTADGQLRIAVFLPQACRVDVVSANGKRVLATLEPLHAEGLFTGFLAGRKAVDYRLLASYADRTELVDDPYRFGRCLDTAELHLFTQGRHETAWQMLGAQPRNVDGVDGVHFVLWAPGARRVSLLLPQRGWDGRVLLMYPHLRHGLWELFVPALEADAAYRYEVMNAQLELTVLRHDPFARQVAVNAEPSSLVAPLPAPSPAQQGDQFWQLARSNLSGQSLPLILHEVPLGSGLQAAGLHWPQLADVLLPAVKRQGFTHVLLRDVQAVWNKGRHRQTALLATMAALGRPAELQSFITQAHALELALVWDLPLAALFEAHGLAVADGIDWAGHGGALASLLLACIGYWHTELHIDGFRLRELDAVLTAAGSKPAGRRKQGGDVNPFAREWLGLVLQQVRERHPSLLLIADTALPLPELTQSVRAGGMGADYRSTEALCPWQLPLSQDRAGAAVAQLLQQWQDGNVHQQLLCLSPQAAQGTLLQLLLLVLWTLPARKAFRNEWRLLSDPTWQPERGHDFQLSFDPALDEAGSQQLLQMNRRYLQHPALFELDASHEGFTLLHCGDGVFAYERSSRHGQEVLLVLANFTSAVASVQLRLAGNRRYRLLYSVGTGAFAPGMHTTGARATGGCTVDVTVAAASAALYALEN